MKMNIKNSLLIFEQISRKHSIIMKKISIRATINLGEFVLVRSSTILRIDSSVVLIEEPDDEPKNPEQDLQRDSSLTSNEQEQQLPLMSSCSTIQSSRMKYPRQNENIPPKYPKNKDFSNPCNAHFVFRLFFFFE